MSLSGSPQVAGAGIEPANTWFKATYFYQQKLPRNDWITHTKETELEVQ